MSNFGKYYEARSFISDIIQKDLVGPVTEDEVLIEAPIQYYSMGKLYPIDQSLDLVDLSSASVIESQIDAYDISLSSTNMRNPSSMGITFTLKKGIEKFSIRIKFALYEPCDNEELCRSGINFSKWEEKTDKNTIFWVRKVHESNLIIDINHLKPEEITSRIFLKVFKHKTFESGESIVTAVLLNNREAKPNDYNYTNANTVLQPVIHISSINQENKDIFTSVLRQIELKQDPELLRMELMYQNYQCYAQGHGCSVIWDYCSKVKPEYIESTFMPDYNLLQMKAATYDNDAIFKMSFLAHADAEDIIKGLRKFIAGYDFWINETFNQSYINANVPEHLKNSAYMNQDECIETRNRIEYAIDLLKQSVETDGFAWRSFQYANEAMYRQRCRIMDAKEEEYSLDEVTWYPFQLAFFLQEISSIVEPEGEDRKTVDLLWFPTGGGKTEAYLGIAAFTIFYRRLKKEESGNGVTVIMRYTLRLLTMQQFERASALICACEILREKNNIPGDEISIGLWVGNGFTPSDLSKATVSLSKLKIGLELSKEEANPCQIKICPWCGSDLTPHNYNINNKMEIKCANEACHFGRTKKALPIYLIDEDIYKKRPSFLVATIDKFAQMTYNGNSALLFGIGTTSLPPELIIQDELHLISGPLGTMTGIYEAAITTLCEKDNIPIKIIASTATIRNASNQIRSLYGRNYKQFPPNGLSIDDSFFAIKSNTNEKPARLYIGCMGVGTTFTTTLIRVYAAWLFASRYLISIAEYDESVIDNFWTLTGYFNSLRELGGARTQVVDDVQSRFQYLKDEKFAHLIPGFQGKGRYDYAEELTSWMSNAEISEIIQKGLKKEYKHDVHEDVYDFILASSMVSVGVDVGRLGTMAVAGQPKTNAEYIQATSRVGRENPGLVLVVYNASRSRDRSHYEQFLKYHTALYQYVEATSLTPFSERARDRGLQAIFVSLCRYMIKELRTNDDAVNFRGDSPQVQSVERIIYSYVNRVDPNELDNVIREIQEIKEEWADKTGGGLCYKSTTKKCLLKPDTDETDRFRTMNSMRSVEKQSGIYLLGGC